MSLWIPEEVFGIMNNLVEIESCWQILQKKLGMLFKGMSKLKDKIDTS